VNSMMINHHSNLFIIISVELSIKTQHSEQPLHHIISADLSTLITVGVSGYEAYPP
jgi:hypothetical protein